MFYSLGYNLNPICEQAYITKLTKEKISNTLKKKIKLGEIKKQGEKKVYQYNRYNGKLIKIWNSVNQANEYYKTPNKTHSSIHKVLWGEYKQAFDSFWSYKPIHIEWVGKPHGKSNCIVVQNVLDNTYSYFDNLLCFIKSYNLKTDSYSLKKYIDSDKLYKNQFKIIKIAPIVYDGKPFELLGTREDRITKTEEEILNVNV